MQIVILFVTILLSMYFIFKKYGLLEKIALSILILVSEVGTIPFFVNEYTNLDFKHSVGCLLLFNMAVLIILFIFNISKLNQYFELRKLTKIEVFLIVVSFLLIIRNLSIPVRGWDAYSMYDGRAYMLLDNLKIKDMVLFNKYDDFNYMYYVSYPPMTSTIHALLYSINLKTPMFLYAGLFVSMLFMLFSMFRNDSHNSLIVVLFVIISAFLPTIFDQINVAYTNIVSMSFQIGAIFMSLKFYKNSKLVEFLCAVFFLAMSNWTRSLEPIFLGIYIGFIYLIIMKKDLYVIKKVLYIVLGFVITLVPIIFWRYYISSNLGDIGGTSQISLFEVISKLPESLYLNNIIEVLFFVYKSLLSIKVYFLIFGLSVFYYFIKLKKSIDIELVFYLIMILMSLAIMIGGTFYFSVSYVWWSEISGSFLRSNLILVPLITLLASKIIKNYE